MTSLQVSNIDDDDLFQDRPSQVNQKLLDMNADEICDTIDTIIKRHEADYTRLYVELDELFKNKDGDSQWQHTARWIKFEEDVDVGSKRWGKPHVGTLSVNAFQKMRKLLMQATTLLDAQLYSRDEINKTIVEEVIKQIPSPGLTEKQLLNLEAAINSDHGSIASVNKKQMVKFESKIPRFAEGCTVQVADFKQIEEPICIFVRLRSSIRFQTLMSADIPSRFLVLIIGKEGFTNELHEVGRCFGTLMSDDVFRGVAYKATKKQELLVGLNEVFDKSWLLPPNEWDPSIILDPPAMKFDRLENFRNAERRVGQSRGIALGDGGFKAEEESDSIEYTGRLFGDFSDGMNLQCFASFVFLYFAVLTPIITFGGLLGDATDNNIAVVESLVGACIAGILFHMFAGQPLTIIGSTGPILIFERISFAMTIKLGLDYLEFRQWIGLWTGIICILIVAFDGSFAVKYITRYTEESFATLISSIFIVDGFKKVIGIEDRYPVNHNWRSQHILDYDCKCIPPPHTEIADWAQNLTFNDVEFNATSRIMIPGRHYEPETIWFSNTSYYCIYRDGATIVNDGDHFVSDYHANWTLNDCWKHCGHFDGKACHGEVQYPDIFFLSLILSFGTLFLSFAFKAIHDSPFFPTKVRKIVSDFAVLLAIVTMTAFDHSMNLETPKLIVPDEITPTRADRGWSIPLIDQNPFWQIFLAVPFAILLSILIFMDHQITAVIVNRRENKLKKGYGYHLDLLVVSIALIVCTVCGLPWFVGATVLSITHVNSLKQSDLDSTAPGEKPEFCGVAEQRITGVLIFLMIGLSVFFTPLLRLIPMPVLYGVFLYMGFSSLKGNQLVDRMLLFFMPQKHQPNYFYLQYVPIKTVHIFTLIQLGGLALLWFIESNHHISICFPLMVAAIVGIRKAMDYFPNIFTQRELSWLDDVIPDEQKTKNNTD